MPRCAMALTHKSVMCSADTGVVLVSSGPTPTIELWNLSDILRVKVSQGSRNYRYMDVNGLSYH